MRLLLQSAGGGLSLQSVLSVIGMKRSGKIALGGLSAALAVVCMLLTAMPVTTYALPLLAGVLLLPFTMEAGKAAGWSAYAVVSVLSLILTPTWEPKILFMLFFGYYPILKLTLDALPRLWQWLLKLGVFNVSMLVGYALLFTLFSLPADTFMLFGINLPLVFLLLGNGVFLLYDMALVRFLRMYQFRWHALFTKIFR